MPRDSDAPPPSPPGSRRPRLLVTRPAARQEPFAARARALGFETIAFPCLEIRPDAAFALPAPAALARYDAVLFTSRHAVETVVGRRPLPWPGTRLWAIGAATADALERAGQPPSRAPVPPYTSEALIAVLDAEPPPASLLVVTGHGGRELLAARQRERGGRVDVLPVYRRDRPAVVPARRRALRERAPDVISLTSDAVLENLVALAGPALPALLSRPLVVNSERCAGRARTLGFSGAIEVARPAGDAGQLDALARLAPLAIDPAL